MRSLSNMLLEWSSSCFTGEAGNVSAHTTHLVGSALSDPCLSQAMRC